MVASEKLLKMFWKMCGKNDLKRLSKQNYPTDLIEVNNLKYDDDGHKHHMLDIYYPKNAKGKLPVIVDMHGGGWFYGDKELNKNYCLHLAQRGFVVFNISYRLVPEVRVKEQIQDCMKALLFVSKAMKEFPCDEKNVYIVGDSAGGQFAAFTAAANVSKKIRDVYDTVSPELNVKAVGLISPVPYLSPKGIMEMYMPHVLGKNYKDEKYADYIDFDKVIAECDNFPPTILFSSIMDVVALSQTKQTFKVLKKNNVASEMSIRMNPSLMHVYQVLDPENKSSVKAIKEMSKFFKKHS